MKRLLLGVVLLMYSTLSYGIQPSTHTASGQACLAGNDISSICTQTHFYQSLSEEEQQILMHWVHTQHDAGMSVAMRVINILEKLLVLQYSEKTHEIGQRLTMLTQLVRNHIQKLAILTRNLHSSTPVALLQCCTPVEAYFRAVTTNSLTVTGNETIAGDLTVGGNLKVTGTGTIGNLIVTGSAVVHGNELIGGTLTVTGSTTLSALTVTGGSNLGQTTISNLNVINNETVGGNLAVTGSAAVGGSLAVAFNETVGGSLSVASNLAVGGNTALGGTLTVTGSTTLSALTVTGGSNLGPTTISTLNVINNESVGGNLSVTGSAALGGSLAVGTNETVGGTLSVTGNTVVGGTLTVTGTVTFGSLGIGVVQSNAAGGLSSSAGAAGQTLIGTTTGTAPVWANLTSHNNTVVVTNGSGSIDLVTTTSVATSYVTNNGTAVPSLSVLNILGGSNITTSTTTPSTVSVSLVNSPVIPGTLTVTGSTTHNNVVSITTTASAPALSISQGAGQNAIQVGAGTITSPALGFSSDPTTGLYLITGGEFAITSSGVNKVSYDGNSVLVSSTYRVDAVATTNQLLAANSTTTINFGTKIVGGSASGFTSPTFTAPTSGVYLVGVVISLTSNLASDTITFSLVKSGSTLYTFTMNGSVTIGGTSTGGGCWLVPLLAGQTLIVQATTGLTSTPTILASPATSLAIHLLSAP